MNKSVHEYIKEDDLDMVLASYSLFYKQDKAVWAHEMYLVRKILDMKKVMPFYKILTDKMNGCSEGIGMIRWKKAFPNFYAWLMDNGFRYDKTKDKSIRRRKVKA